MVQNDDSQVKRVNKQNNNPALLYVLSLGSKVSRDTVKRKLQKITKLSDLTMEDYPWNELDPIKVQLIINELESQGLSFSSVNAYLSALKGVAKQAWRNGDMDGDVLARIKDIPNRKGSRLPAGQTIAQDNVLKLISTCESNPNQVKAVRDAAILVLGFYVGLRRSEIGKIKLSDFDTVMGELRVIGKGNKERKVPAPVIAQTYINKWIKLRFEQVMDKKLVGDFLFGRTRIDNKGSLINLNGLSGNAIREIIVDTCKRSGVDFNILPTPHDMRRTAVTRWLQSGDPRVAQALAGHENIQTTMGYARDDLTDKMRVVAEGGDLLTTHSPRH